mgnify:CR=1 FL=1
MAKLPDACEPFGCAWLQAVKHAESSAEAHFAKQSRTAAHSGAAEHAARTSQQLLSTHALHSGVVSVCCGPRIGVVPQEIQLFAGTIAEGQIWGRGIQDDKGPLIQSLYGMFAARQAGIRPPCHVRILIGTQEETGDWDDVKSYVETEGAPDYAFPPDANFPIINGEKGMMSVRYDADWQMPEAPANGLRFISLKGGELLSASLKGGALDRRPRGL